MIDIVNDSNNLDIEILTFICFKTPKMCRIITISHVFWNKCIRKNQEIYKKVQAIASSMVAHLEFIYKKQEASRKSRDYVYGN